MALQEDEDVFFKMRMPGKLHAAIKQIAEGNRRSISQEIILRLEASLGDADASLFAGPDAPAKAGSHRGDRGPKAVFSNPLFGEDFRAGVLKILREEALISRPKTAAKKPPAKK